MHFCHYDSGGFQDPWTYFSNNLICHFHKFRTVENNLFSVSCTTVDHPKSGNVSVSTDGTTSTATFTCVSGYKLIGEQIITCGEDGQWSDAIPYCGKIYLRNRSAPANCCLIIHCSDVSSKEDQIMSA